jgi:hypothetical protein
MRPPIHRTRVSRKTRRRSSHQLEADEHRVTRPEDDARHRGCGPAFEDGPPPRRILRSTDDLEGPVSISDDERSIRPSRESRDAGLDGRADLRASSRRLAPGAPEAHEAIHAPGHDQLAVRLCVDRLHPLRVLEREPRPGCGPHQRAPIVASAQHSPVRGEPHVASSTAVIVEG